MDEFTSVQDIIEWMIYVTLFGVVLIFLFYGFDRKRYREQETERARREVERIKREEEREKRLLQKLDAILEAIETSNLGG